MNQDEKRNQLGHSDFRIRPAIYSAPFTRTGNSGTVRSIPQSANSATGENICRKEDQGILVYFAEISLLNGSDKLSLLPIGLSALIVLLIPALIFFGTALASMISSRVRTFQAAQNY